MKTTKEFPFEKARRVSPKEVSAAQKAIEKKTGKKRRVRGRPTKLEEEKYIPTSIRLHPKVLAWAKREAKKKSTGYQSIINEFLLKKSV
ncbi:MAG: BrnA antitoxin family protein [Bacteriovoracales bacterium]|nr:BrnA antitoxin family protein [Bacteriovoracales bacterium]